MIPSSRDAARSERPLPGIVILMKGTSTINPKKPYTTEGMPASSSMPGRRTDATLLPAKRDRYIAVRMPAGTPTRMAPAVT